MKFISVAFVAVITIAPLSMILGCGALVDILSYSFVLLEESLAFMGSAEDQQEMAPKDALERHPKLSFLLCRNPC